MKSKIKHTLFEIVMLAVMVLVMLWAFSPLMTVVTHAASGAGHLISSPHDTHTSHKSYPSPGLDAIKDSVLLATFYHLFPGQEPESEKVTDLGTWRITEYCNACSGGLTASGKVPEPGMAAMNGVPLGTVINVEGEELVVEDRCGIDGTVDIFVYWPDGECHCSLLEYRKVVMLE